jgi:hypothetical protein
VVSRPHVHDQAFNSSGVSGMLNLGSFPIWRPTDPDLESWPRRGTRTLSYMSS